MQGLNRRNWRGRSLAKRRKEELDGKWEGDTHQAWMGWQQGLEWVGEW